MQSAEMKICGNSPFASRHPQPSGPSHTITQGKYERTCGGGLESGGRWAPAAANEVRGKNVPKIGFPVIGLFRGRGLFAMEIRLWFDNVCRNSRNKRKPILNCGPSFIWGVGSDAGGGEED